MNSDLKYYTAIFARRLPIFMSLFLAFTAIGVILAIYLPTVFTSTARLLVESAQIEDQTVTISASEQLEIVEQRLMTRATLIDIARDNDVYEDIGSMNPDEIVDAMRKDSKFRSTSGRDRATLMEIHFDGRTSQVASAVVNEYVTRILNDNVTIRTRQAGSTLEFYTQEVDRLGTELSLQSAKIIEFQNNNSDALPDSLEYRLSRQTSLQERLSQISRDISALEEHRARLIQVFETTGRLTTESDRALTPEEKQLKALQDELSGALAIYSETNPRVKLLRSRVTQLEAVVSAQSGARPADDGKQEATLLDLQLTEIDSRSASLKEQISTIEFELFELADSIKKTPANAIALESLNRDYKNTQDQYNLSVERKSQAATGERIELLSKGEKISVIEQATRPTEPTRPNRPLVAGGGIFFGLASGIGLIFLLELLNTSIRRPAQLTKALGITPLGTIPYIRTRGETVRSRFILLMILALFLIGIPAILYLIHTQYLPLDLILSNLLEKIGI